MGLGVLHSRSTEKNELSYNYLREKVLGEWKRGDHFHKLVLNWRPFPFTPTTQPTKPWWKLINKIKIEYGPLNMLRYNYLHEKVGEGGKETTSTSWY
jgi:hypothetical protein